MADIFCRLELFIFCSRFSHPARCEMLVCWYYGGCLLTGTFMSELPECTQDLMIDITRSYYQHFVPDTRSPASPRWHTTIITHSPTLFILCAHNVLSHCIRNWSHIAAHLITVLEKSPRLQFKLDRDEIQQECSTCTCQYALIDMSRSDFWCDVIFSRWRPWHHFTQKCCHLVSAWCICSSMLVPDP